MAGETVPARKGDTFSLIVSSKQYFVKLIFYSLKNGNSSA